MICFDFSCQPVPWLSEVPEDKDIMIETCSGNAKSGFCGDIAYLFISERDSIERGGKNNKEGKNV